MADEVEFTINEAGWDELVSGIINTEGVRRMEAVAAACNAADGLVDGYRVGIEGDGEQLQKHDQRMTVITATAEAQVANAKNNTLERHLPLAGGA